MLMEIDGTFIAVTVSFLIFLFIIKKILFQPITKVVQERNNFYVKNSKMETDSKEKSKNLLLEKERLLSQTRSEAGSIVKNATDEARKESEEKISTKKDEIKNKTEEKKDELSLECKKVKQEIKSEISDIVSKIVTSVLKKDVKVEIDEAKIEEYLT